MTVDLSALENGPTMEPANEPLEHGAGLFTQIRRLVDDAGRRIEENRRYLYGVFLALAARRYGVRVVTKKALDTIGGALEDVKQAFRS